MKRKVLFFEGNGLPFISNKQGRNDKCRCGSGKKAKNCCGTETKYYHKKIKAESNEQLSNQNQSNQNTGSNLH